MKKQPLAKSAPKKPIVCEMRIEGEPDGNMELDLTKTVAGPVVSNAFAAFQFGKRILADRNLSNVAIAFVDSSKQIKANDLNAVEATLNAQAMTLNLMFGELVQRSAQYLHGDTIRVDAVEAFFKMAMKAQNQCRMTLETLANVKNGPMIYAKQANINNGGQQQVNNGTNSRAPAGENPIPPNKLLEVPNETPMDSRAASQPVGGHPELATVDEGHWPQYG